MLNNHTAAAGQQKPIWGFRRGSLDTDTDTDADIDTDTDIDTDADADTDTHRYTQYHLAGGVTCAVG